MRLITALLLLSCAGGVWAERVESRIGALTGYASYVGAQQTGPVFVIVHGTWAHFGMELIAALQESLAERGYASLAPNLTLAVERRLGFRDCQAPFPRHEDALSDIAAWVSYLQTRGRTEIVLLGHSRGGAQVAAYLAAPASAVVRGGLLAPMVFRASAERLSTLDAAAAQQARRGFVGPTTLLNCENVAVAYATFASYYGDVPEKHTPNLLPAVQVPLQIFLGTEDSISRWTADEIAAANARQFVEVHRIDGADHFFRDLYAEDVVDLLAPDR